MMQAGQAQAAIEALPLRSFEAIFGRGAILVLAPHPDDESLGCGGMIAEACALGHELHVAILTDGSRSHPGSEAWPPARLAAQRRSEARAATAELGLPADRLTFMDLPDTDAPHDGPAFGSALERVSALIGLHGIATVCATWAGDPHGDHGSAAKLAAAACQRTGARHIAYPVWAWTVAKDGALPPVSEGARLDVARHLPAKRRAIAAHATQHGRVVQDDPAGFTLPGEFLALFDRPWEAFLDQ